MSDYTPMTDVIRAGYVDARYFNSQGMESREDVATEFDRWLAQERAQAKAEALREAADALQALRKYGLSGYKYEKCLRVRANEIERASNE